MNTMNWSRENLAWLAGLIEGDGCIHEESKGNKIRMTVGMTDLDVLERVQHIAGAGKIRGPYQNTAIGSYNIKPMYYWSTSSGPAYALLVALFPWFGNRRRDKVSLAISQFAKAKVYNGTKIQCDKGHAFTEDNTWIEANGKRHCRTCRREAARRFRAARSGA